MKPRTRIILLSIISVLIIITIVLGVTYSFMRPGIDTESVTEVTLQSCAKITLEDTDVSIDLNNTYPMSKNKALQTTPYTFTVTSSCENYVGFNLYLATLNTNTLDASNIHYIITKNNSKDILTEGILSNATNAISEFTAEEQTQYNNGINGTFSTIYKLYNDSIPLKGESTYDLYLYVDESVTDASTMNKTFNAGVAVKSYDREGTFSEYIISTYGGGENGLYYHDSSLANSAEDNSYRYAGADPNNYVCFGSDEETCPNDNLYRIIGVFDDEVKLIKADYLSTEYGAIDNYENFIGDTGTYSGNMNLSDIGGYAWDSGSSNTWSSSTIRSTLNTTYYSTLSATWQNKIATHTWKVGEMAWSDTNTAKQYYDIEVGSSSSSTTDSMKIGLMYVSDFGFAASNSNWTTALSNYYSVRSTNWLYLGNLEWTVTSYSSNSYSAFLLYHDGNLNISNASNGYSARPVFYLNSNVTYVSGNGTESNPYRIS